MLNYRNINFFFLNKLNFLKVYLTFSYLVLVSSYQLSQISAQYLFVIFYSHFLLILVNTDFTWLFFFGTGWPFSRTFLFSIMFGFCWIFGFHTEARFFCSDVHSFDVSMELNLNGRTKYLCLYFHSSLCFL